MNGRSFNKLRVCPVLDTGANESMNNEIEENKEEGLGAQQQGLTLTCLASAEAA